MKTSKLLFVRNWTAAFLFAATFGGGAMTIAAPQPTYACTDRLLTFPAWYKGLQNPDPDCTIRSPTELAGGYQEMIATILLNVTEIILQAVGYVSVAFIIVGGFKYITSAGSPDGMTKSRKTIINAVVGLIISIFSVAIVNLISGAIT